MADSPPDELIAALRRPESLPDLPLRAWPALIRKARRAGLLSRLAFLLGDRGLLGKVPEPPRRHLEEAQILAEKHRRDVFWEVRCIRTALAPLGVPIILLKGGAYALAGLPPSRGRLFGDIDILLPRDAIAEAERLLTAAGWRAAKVGKWDERFYREWMHQIPPMVHEYRDTLVDVHHTIVPPTARTKLAPERLFEAARPIPDHPGLLTLDAADMVAHSATHLFNEGEFGRGLRDLVDLDSLLRHFGAEPGFWSRLLPRARELDLERPVLYALRYAARILETPLPPQIAAADTGHPVMDRLFERVLTDFAGERERVAAAVARGVLYVRGHWIRLPPRLLVPHLLRKALLRSSKGGGAGP